MLLILEIDGKKSWYLTQGSHSIVSSSCVPGNAETRLLPSNAIASYCLQKKEDPEETRVKELEKSQLEKAKSTGHTHKT